MKDEKCGTKSSGDIKDEKKQGKGCSTSKPQGGKGGSSCGCGGKK